MLTEEVAGREDNALDTEPEEGCLSVWTDDEIRTTAFTRSGVEHLKELVEPYKAPWPLTAPNSYTVVFTLAAGGLLSLEIGDTSSGEIASTRLKRSTEKLPKCLVNQKVPRLAGADPIRIDRWISGGKSSAGDPSVMVL